MQDLFNQINELEDFTTENIENTFNEFITKKEIGMGAVLPCMRLILTGKGMGPSIFAIASLLGKEEVMSRYQEQNQYFSNLFLAKKQAQ